MAMFNNKRVMMLSNLCLAKRYFAKPHLPRVCFPPTNQAYFGVLNKEVFTIRRIQRYNWYNFQEFFSLELHSATFKGGIRSRANKKISAKTVIVRSSFFVFSFLIP